MRYCILGGSGFIGTNMIWELRKHDSDILNLDTAQPLDASQNIFWKYCDILDHNNLLLNFDTFRPEIVIHLAARTDCDENTTVEEGYKTNTQGTSNVLSAIKTTPSVQRVIITSSQYVCGPGYTPKGDEDFAPHTVYGASKAESERLTRKAGLNCTWTIVRPTNIWGPWHMRYRREFWNILKKGLYVHPGGAPVIRSYGYVENVVWQIIRLAKLPKDQVDGKVFYLGDPPADIYEWTNAFSMALRGRPARKVPRILLSSLGAAGSFLGLLGIKAPITLSRYRSMTTDYPTSIADTTELLGSPPFSLKQGVTRTAAWLREMDKTDIGRPEKQNHQTL